MKLKIIADPASAVPAILVLRDVRTGNDISSVTIEPGAEAEVEVGIEHTISVQRGLPASEPAPDTVQDAPADDEAEVEPTIKDIQTAAALAKKGDKAATLRDVNKALKESGKSAITSEQLKAALSE